MAMFKCSKCLKKKWSYSYNDDDGKITATCKCGNIVSWISKKRKQRKPITEELVLNHNPVIAILEFGKLVKPTSVDILEKKLYILNKAKSLNII